MNHLIPEKKLRTEIIGVSAVTFWHWRRTGRLDGLPAIIIGNRGRRWYRHEDIERWLTELAAAN